VVNYFSTPAVDLSTVHSGVNCTLLWTLIIYRNRELQDMTFTFKYDFFTVLRWTSVPDIHVKVISCSSKTHRHTGTGLIAALWPKWWVIQNPSVSKDCCAHLFYFPKSKVATARRNWENKRTNRSVNKKKLLNLIASFDCFLTDRSGVGQISKYIVIFSINNRL